MGAMHGRIPELLNRLFARHRRGSSAFTQRRRGARFNEADLVQEVYRRFLMAKNTEEAIRHPEAYLYQLASNFLKECK